MECRNPEYFASQDFRNFLQEAESFQVIIINRALSRSRLYFLSGAVEKDCSWFRRILMAVFIPEDALSVWTNLGKHLLLDRLCVSSIKTGTRRIMRLDELSSAVCLSRQTTNDSSSRRIMRLVPVFILRRIMRPTTNVCPSSSRRIMRPLV